MYEDVRSILAQRCAHFNTMHCTLYLQIGMYNARHDLDGGLAMGQRGIEIGRLPRLYKDDIPSS